jgi:hypothetical protein
VGKSFLEMTDEELLAAPVPTFEAEEVAAAVEAAAPGSGEGDAAPAGDEQAQAPAQEADPVANPEPEGTPAQEAGEAADQAPEGEAQEAKPGKEVQEPPAKAEADKEDKSAEEIDYKAAYEQLMAPFKANGREVQVKSAEDAKALMQMGANYNKKMAGLKPNLKLLKMLENNQLLNEEKLSFLIEVSKKNPDAIAKLLKDSGIDPMGIEPEKADSYKPTNHAVDDREVELDTVLDDLKASPHYPKVISIVSEEWDAKSKQIIADSPQLLGVIHDHVERGIYDLIAKELESERLFGRLTGMSDIEAYRQVGDAINARGGFNHLVRGQGKAQSEAKVVAPAPKKAEDDSLKEKRRAAAPSKPVVSNTGVPKEFNPLAMSDEDFAKMSKPVFA